MLKTPMQIVFKATHAMNRMYPTLLLVFSLLAIPLLSLAQESSSSTIDKIVAVVNDHIILKSDVDQQVQQYLMQMQQQNQQVPFGEDMWYAMLQNIVDRNIKLEQAERDSVEVTNQQVDQQIDQRIMQSVQQLGSEAELEKQMGKSIIQIKADLRDNYREQMTVQRLEQLKREEIQITRPEVRKYFDS